MDDEDWIDVGEDDDDVISITISIAPSPEIVLRSEEDFKRSLIEKPKRSLKYYNAETSASRALLTRRLKSKCPHQRQAALDVASGAYEMKDGTIYLPTRSKYLSKDSVERELFLQYLYKGCQEKGCCLKA